MTLNSSSLSSAQLHDVAQCLADRRLSSSIAAASSALLFYDYALTWSEEIQFFWASKRQATVGRILFFLARYPALAGAVIALLPATVTLGNVLTCTRLVTIIFADFIFVARTLAVWQHDRRLLIFYTCFTIACVVPPICISQKDIVTTVAAPDLPVISVACEVLVSSVKDVWVVPYAIAIVYEFITLSLLLYKILAYFRDLPLEYRPQLFHALRRDGIAYFVLMFMFGVLNIALVVQVTNPLLRTAGTQLQTVTHSILSTRTVFHLYSISSQNLPGTGGLHLPTGHKLNTMQFWNRNTNAGTPNTGARDDAAVDSTSVIRETLGSDLRTPSMNVRSSQDNQTEDVETGLAYMIGGTRTGNAL